METLDLDAPLSLPASTSAQLKLKELSYSSACTLHSCPRKYQIDKTTPRLERSTSVTFAFGHAVGEGIQRVIAGESEQSVLMEMFLIWDVFLLDDLPKAKKSIWEAVLAVRKFADYYTESDLDNYELAVVNGVPATELAFRINLPNGYSYRGFIDVVLAHKVTGALLVLEIKTSGAYTLNEAQYKHSAQALGYTIVLDTINPLATKHSFEVRYLVYKTRQQEFQEFSFIKMFSQKLGWIQSVLSDCERITAYTEQAHFPLHGESCFNYFSQCTHFNTCQLKDSNLRLNMDSRSTDTTEYTLDLNLNEILESLDKGITNG